MVAPFVLNLRCISQFSSGCAGNAVLANENGSHRVIVIAGSLPFSGVTYEDAPTRRPIVCRGIARRCITGDEQAC